MCYRECFETCPTNVQYTGVDMKIAALVATLIVFSPAATAAQGPSCQSISKENDRLPCYDKATPPIAATKQATKASKAGPKTQSDQVDLLAAENSKLDKRLKTICRG